MKPKAVVFDFGGKNLIKGWLELAKNKIDAVGSIEGKRNGIVFALKF